VYGKKETDLGQAESGMSLLQQAKAETSGQNGKDGVSEGINTVSGGKVGSDNVGNNDNSFNGNGGNGGHVSCLETCFAREEVVVTTILVITATQIMVTEEMRATFVDADLNFALLEEAKAVRAIQNNLFSNNGDGIFWPIVLTLVWLWP
jgi:hypothetical protein